MEVPHAAATTDALTRAGADLARAGEFAIYITALAGLFFIRRRFIPPEKRTRSSQEGNDEEMQQTNGHQVDVEAKVQEPDKVNEPTLTIKEK